MEVLSLMLRLRQDGKSFWAIADELNRLGIRTGRGSEWDASTVRLQLNMLALMAREDASKAASDRIPAPSAAKRQSAAPKHPEAFPDFGTWLDRQTPKPAVR
jgi:hypothetical protein